MSSVPWLAKLGQFETNKSVHFSLCDAISFLRDIFSRFGEDLAELRENQEDFTVTTLARRSPLRALSNRSCLLLGGVVGTSNLVD